ncbi:GNAT family N-acetyltransferase [Sporosalibacterium faouarense]|uniref:GNAT family N-acetyltransferase n=1 Tax=Sporosalibacterium faouarense TaxID=516123 RepID=UPI00192C8333|nr:GNAT family N-acetyltransferase [Sporosalibacterium faouarense]
MRFEKYDSISEFEKTTEKLLLKNEVENNLPLGIINGISNNPESFEDKEKAFLGLVRDGKDNINLITIMTPPNNIIVSGVGNQIGESIKEAIEFLITHNIEVPGVIGVKDIANEFAKQWAETNNCIIKVHMDQRIYRLDKVNSIKKSSGKLRKATLKDIELIAKWMGDFNIEAVDVELSEEELINKAKDHIKNKKLYIWEDEKPVSMVGKTRPTKNGIVISYVFTPKEHRGKGYATTSVATFSQMLLDEGYKYCSLYTDLSNSISNSIYMNIGYKPIVDSIVYNFK